MTNPFLVVEEHPGAVGLVNFEKGKFARGAGVIGDIESFISEAGNDGWLGEFGAAASLGANAVSAVFNPVASLTGWVVSWIIDHLHPLPEMLQEFTGDPEEIKAGAETWAKIGLAAHAEADKLDSLLAKIDGEVSQALDAYRRRVGQMSELLRAEGDAATQVAGMLQKQAGIVDFLYNFVRDLISEAIGMFFQSAAEALFTMGAAIPPVVAKISFWVGNKMAEVTKWVNEGLKSFAAGSELKALLVEALRGLAKFAKETAKEATTILNKPGDFLNTQAGELGSAFGKSLSKGNKVDDVSGIFKALRRARGKEKIAVLEDRLPESFTRTPKVPPAPEGKTQIPAGLTQEILRTQGVQRFRRVFESAGLDLQKVDFNGWFRALTKEQRAIFVRGLSKNEAEMLLRNMSAKDQADLFSLFPERGQRERLMKISGVIEKGGNLRKGTNFLAERLGPVAAGSSKWAGVTDAELEDEDYDLPKE